MRFHTYWAQRYRGRSQPNESAIPRMRLMDRICILVTELGDNPLYPVEICSGERLADEALELEGAAFPLVVELVVERFCDVGVHVAICGGPSTWRGQQECYRTCLQNECICAGGGRRCSARSRCRCRGLQD